MAVRRAWWCGEVSVMQPVWRYVSLGSCAENPELWPLWGQERELLERVPIVPSGARLGGLAVAASGGLVRSLVRSAQLPSLLSQPYPEQGTGLYEAVRVDGVPEQVVQSEVEA
jgi:hypothetical protein